MEKKKYEVDYCVIGEFYFNQTVEAESKEAAEELVAESAWHELDRLAGRFKNRDCQVDITELKENA